MRRLHLLTRTSLLVLSLALGAFAAQGDYIVTLKNPGNGNGNGYGLAQQLGVSIKAWLHGNDTFLTSLPSGPLGNLLLAALKASPLVSNIEADVNLALPEVSGWPGKIKTYPASEHTCATPGNLKSGQLTPSQYFVAQPAVCLVNLPKAQNAGFKGAAVTMALVDTWVDIHHPEFGGSVDPALSMSFADPSNPVVLAQETSPMVDQETSPMVDQETSPMVDGSGAIILNQETSPMVDQETSPMVDSKNPPYAGHGTGVAGIMHLVAPQSRILALEAFSAATGTGSVSSIVAAINYAVANHVDVINLSFTVPAGTQGISALAKAISDAEGAGVVIVASVPDSGGALSYPAGYAGVTSVACTDNNDKVCTFSGIVGWADIYAPGYQVMSLYPGNRHALYTGTSFSAPWATGAASLMNFKINGQALGQQSQAASNALSNGDNIGKGLERLDIVTAISGK
jgi:hypothetical protein